MSQTTKKKTARIEQCMGCVCLNSIPHAEKSGVHHAHTWNSDGSTGVYVQIEAAYQFPQQIDHQAQRLISKHLWCLCCCEDPQQYLWRSAPRREQTNKVRKTVQFAAKYPKRIQVLKKHSFSPHAHTCYVVSYNSPRLTYIGKDEKVAFVSFSSVMRLKAWCCCITKGFNAMILISWWLTGGLCDLLENTDHFFVKRLAFIRLRQFLFCHACVC